VLQLAGASSRSAPLGEAGEHKIIFDIFNVNVRVHIGRRDAARASRLKVKRACLFSGRRSND